MLYIYSLGIRGKDKRLYRSTSYIDKAYISNIKALMDGLHKCKELQIHYNESGGLPSIDFQLLTVVENKDKALETVKFIKSKVPNYKLYKNSEEINNLRSREAWI